MASALGKRKINWILDADIAKFFDTLEQGQLLEFLEHRIGDRRVIQLIDKWLTAGVMEDGLRSDTGRGTPQGANVSPVPANVYLSCWIQHDRNNVGSPVMLAVSRN